MLFLRFEYCPDGEMVDALVSGASAARHVGSSPILGTRAVRGLLFFCAQNRTLQCKPCESYTYNPSKPPFDKGGLWQVFHLLTSGDSVVQ